MPTYKVGLNAAKTRIHLAVGAASIPAGYTQLGTFTMNDVTDPTSPVSTNSVTEVLYHQVQEILGRTEWDDITEAALFPDNITDMSSLTIYKGWASAPEVVTAPTITGTAQVGEVLTSVLGTWTGSPTTARQWKANGVNIPNATAATYTVLIGDLDKTITVEVTATNAFGVTTTLTVPTAAVIAE